MVAVDRGRAGRDQRLSARPRDSAGHARGCRRHAGPVGAATARSFGGDSGRALIFPSDELFLLAGRELPGTAYYEDFPQVQNGVGLTRIMLADWRRARRRLPEQVSPPGVVAWLCGRAAAPALRLMAEEAAPVDGLTVEVRVVENTLFGSSITVSGLMSGRDIVRVLQQARPIWRCCRATRSGSRASGRWTSGRSPRSSEETGVPIRLGRTAGDLVVAEHRHPDVGAAMPDRGGHRC